MSNQKNEQGFRDIVTKEEFKVLHDALEYVNIPFSTKYNALYDLKDASGFVTHVQDRIDCQQGRGRSVSHAQR
jgi:hypothetical protein